ncbi:cation efflux family protein [Loa loa]|uniref:Cation efflux family protein n=1 Tax=Loa loa TaxID=7209 RepID=A0A1S0TX02_LOALO|nr:cation efflux family protein [Loa loa]EFO20899.2 cation efflux family protein [Loa loa]
MLRTAFLLTKPSHALFHTCGFNGKFNELKGRLFRAAQSSRKRNVATEDIIEETRAMLEFGLTREHLQNLPRKELFPKKAMYNVEDVYNKALQVHGERGIQQRMQLYQKYLYHNSLFDERKQKRNQSTSLAAEDATNAVKIALGTNFLDVCFKLYGAFITGSKSLAAEGLHSSLDLTNQIILMYGIRWSKLNPTPTYPYGYGNARYIASLISGCWLFGFGGGVSLYHGVTGLLHPHAIESPAWAFITLTMSFLLQGSSASYAWWKVRRKAKQCRMSIIEYVRTSADPSLSVVCLEDSASILGAFISASSIALSCVLETSIPDSVGSVLIGILLGSIAAFIIRNNAMHLAGKSVPQIVINDIVAQLRHDNIIKSVHDVKAVGHGVGQVRFKAEVEYDGRAITNLYLSESCHIPSVIEEVKKIKDEEGLRRFMLHHGEHIVNRIADEVDRIEEVITKKHPDVKHVDLEPL